MNKFSEDNLVEQTVIDLVKQVWQDEDCHINAFTDAEDAKLGREHRGEVVLKKFLLPALQKLNPELPEDALHDAINQITRNRSQLSLVRANQEIYNLLKDGVSVTVTKPDGSKETEKVQVIDFENPDNNHFLCVSQLWVAGENYTRRLDLVIFVNGLPLIIIELKASHKNLLDAYKNNMRDYKDTIPDLFGFNLGIIISNGIKSKFGSLTAPYEYFNEWKKVNSENDETRTDLKTIIHGLIDKQRMLDIFENYILFDESFGEPVKIVPRYFQYYGVNRAFERVINRKEIEGKLGVFWHTQGSGKSYSMVFLSQKVLRKLKGNYTFIIVTDRTQLDGQAYDGFANVGAVYEQEVHADSIENLHQLLSEDHRQIFTTIQKFQNIDGAISNRDDIIIMTDEAHRTQYDRMAQNMRKALPNSSFIGFTGTPLMDHGEEKTRETFGEYVSIYNYGQSVEDGSTVPLFYENRVPKLQNVNQNLENDLASIMDYYELNEDEEEKVEQEFSTFYQLVTREDRLNAIARDIVQHFVGRGYDGKAMVVCLDKKTTVRMYDKVKKEWDRYIAKLHIELSKGQDEYEKGKIIEKLERHEKVDMAVVVSQSQNEISDLEPFEIDMRKLRERIQKEDLETEFKKENSNLRIVFVCAMWMTGFNVPNLSTLYLDKPLKNHTLMQTIARANRVASGKSHGLIVDYIGVFKNVQRALAVYASTNSEDDIIKSKSELVEKLRNLIVKTNALLLSEQVSIQTLLAAPNEQKLLLIDQYTNSLLAKEITKRKFLNFSADLYKAFKAVLPDPSAEDYYDYVTAIRVIASRIRDVSAQDIDTSPVKKDLEDLLDRSIQAGEYVIPKQKKVKDLSKLDADALHKFFAELDNKNMQVESLKSELEQKIEEMMRRNKQRARFMDRLQDLLEEYNSGAHDIDQLFDDLVDLAKELSVEEQRSVKENLTEEELAIFDLLLKEKLDPKEVDEVKKVTRELLDKLKKEKLVLDWREREITRAGVRTTIFDTLYGYLPEPAYSEQDCEHKGLEIYNFVYEHYIDSPSTVYQ